MKKVVITIIVLVLLLANFGVALAAPWGNPNGYWLEGVTCGEHGEPFDVWVHSPGSAASFDEFGEVGVMKAIYIFNEDTEEYDLIWGVPGKGFKNLVWCEWEFDGGLFAGEVLSK